MKDANDQEGQVSVTLNSWAGRGGRRYGLFASGTLKGHKSLSERRIRDRLATDEEEEA